MRKPRPPKAAPITLEQRTRVLRAWWSDPGVAALLAAHKHPFKVDGFAIVWRWGAEELAHVAFRIREKGYSTIAGLIEDEAIKWNDPYFGLGLKHGELKRGPGGAVLLDD